MSTPIPIPPHHGAYANHNGSYNNQYPSYDAGYPVDDVDGHGHNHHNNKKDKKKIVETAYAGYIIKPLESKLGDKKTWAKVGKTTLPFDSEKLYDIAKKHRKETRQDAGAVFKTLLLNQQGVIDRLIAEQEQKESNRNAKWTLYDVQKNKKDIPRNAFRMDRETVSLQVILKRQDQRNSSISSKDTGKAGKGSTFQGEIIDLSVPLKGRKNKNGKKNGADDLDDFDDLSDLLDGIDLNKTHGHKHAHVEHYPQSPVHEMHGHDHQRYDDHDNQRYDYHDQPRYDNHAQYDDHHQEQRPYPQHNPQQYLQYPQQGYQQQPVPPAPMPPQYPPNPFMPEVGHPEQYEMPPQLPNEARYELNYSPRRMSRSRSRHRHPSRHRSRSHHRHHRNSYGSSEDSFQNDGIWTPGNASEFTPPSTPDLEAAQIYGSLGRHGSKRYAYIPERRTKYANERVYVQPAVTTRYETRLVAPRRRRPVIHAIDDYPRQGRITNYAEGYDEADFRNDRYDDDVFREIGGRRERRYDDSPRLSRRYTVRG